MALPPQFLKKKADPKKPNQKELQQAAQERMTATAANKKKPNPFAQFAKK